MMASYTPNLSLYKPDDSDNYEVFREGLNENMDKLDQGGGNQNIAEEYDDTATYTVGDYVIYDGLLYKCDTAVTTAETFDPTKWTHVVVTDEMGSGGGSGDTVTWTQIQQTGTKIAEIDINGTPQDVYAPQGGGSGGHTIYDKDGTALVQENGLQFTGAVSVSDDSVNGRTVVDIEGGGNYYLNTFYSTEEKKVGYWTDGKPLYALTVEVNSVAYNNWTDVFYLANADIKGYDSRTSYAQLTNGERIQLDWFVTTSIYNRSIITNSGTRFRVETHGNNYSKIVATILYTKTTDTPELNPQFGNVIYLPTIYSEEERQVGVWTDGKPLYQKTINIASTTIPSGGSVTFSLQTLGIQNAEKIVNADGTAMAGATTIPFNYLSYYSGTLFAITLTIEGDTLMLSRSSSTAITLTDVCITVQYTKTTDTAGSGDWTPSGELAHHYSTNEQVIGTWIDGKPLYEKAFTGLSQSTSGNNWVTISGVTISNIGEVVEMKAYSIGGSGNMIKVALAEYSRNNSGNGVQVSVVSSAFNRTINTVVVQYTKTTD